MISTLNPQQGYKPLDFGGEGINGSIDRDGRILAINSYHAEHGYIMLTSALPFTEAERYNQAAVRAYRKNLASLEGFGLSFVDPITHREAELVNGAIPCIRLTLQSGIVAEATTFVPRAGVVVQRWKFSEAGVFGRCTGKVWLQRCAYTQITEGGPITIPSPQTTLIHQQDGLIGLENEALGAAVYFTGYGCTARENGGIEFTTNGASSLQEEAVFIFGLGSDPASALENFSYGKAQPIEKLYQEAECRVPVVSDDKMLQRAVTYGSNMGIPVEDGLCILTDHMLLPLSWNRDAYYIALMMLHLPQPDFDFVKRHLIWMFDIAQRPEKYWGRSYMANGRVKDHGFQLDQQLFPLLELADYVLASGDRAVFERFAGQIKAVFEMLVARKAKTGALFSTDETPADDPIALPYHLSSHLLFCRTLHQLNQIAPHAPWKILANEIKAAIGNYFIADGLYAYATDGAGRHHFYHDANDLPFMLAPAWGLIPADDPVWLATVDFAFSPRNVGGYYGGRLGSVHTPAAWPLGDVQELIFGQWTAQAEHETRARAALNKAVQWDGGLPEAYDPETGATFSRHWFAWPSAAFACVELGAFKK
jgi:uncharacterized protein